ncbi:MAG: serine hydrolase [Bacteroidota bacterium]
MKYLLFPCIFLFCLPLLKAQSLDSAAIDEIFAEWDQAHTPGCALGIFQEGEIVYAKGYGLANLEYEIPNDAQSVFRIGSTSKQFTAACIVLLAQADKLALDDPLRKFFPDFPAYANQITVRHLLNHTSGLRDYLTLSFLKGLGDDDWYRDEDIMDWLVKQQALNFEPGSEFLYSNSGYWLLGQIVNQVSGMNMADFAQQAIFEPLGMSHTHFHNNHNRIVKKRASGYSPTGPDTYEISMTTLNMIGDGGIFTSIEDIKKWDDAYYRSETLSPAFWAAMTERGLLNNGDTLDYAAGLFVDQHKGLPVISHGGAFVGFRAELMRFPEQRLSIAVFANRADANPTGMAFQVADILLADTYPKVEKPQVAEKEAVAPTEPQPEIALKNLVGLYELRVGLAMEVSLVGDSLQILQQWNQEQYRIARTSGNTFQLPEDESVSFTFSDPEGGMAQWLTVFQGGRNYPARRKEPLDLSALKLEDYVGSYVSEELEVRFEIRLEDDKLFMQPGKLEEVRLNPDEKDVFVFSGGKLTFQREAGKVVSFGLDAGRAKGFGFKRE